MGRGNRWTTLLRIMLAVRCCIGFPSPVFYGAAIDSSCLVRQRSCDRAGACLLYDADSFRVHLHALPLVGKFVATCLYCAALGFSARRDRRRGVTPLTPPQLSTVMHRRRRRRTAAEKPKFRRSSFPVTHSR